MIFTTVSAQAQTKSAKLPAPTRQPGLPQIAEGRAAASTARTLHTIELRGPAGRLEALFNQGAPDAKYAALVCHPHPLGGGNLHNKVVYHAMKALNDPAWELGFPVLRFNFRGTGRSEGTHDGFAEAEDVLAGLDWLKSEFHLPTIAVGFSFGAVMMLQACCRPNRNHDIRALVALGLPIEAQDHRYEYPFLKDVLIPKLFLSGDRDSFAPAAQLRQLVASAADPKHLFFLPGADHFFSSQLEPMQKVLSGWLKEQLL